MIKIYCDGFLHFKNLYNGCSVGVCIDDDIKISRIVLSDMQKSFKFINNYKITNNVVEYFALYSALYVAGKFSERAHIFSDSMLVVNQFNEIWGINHEHLQIWHSLCWSVMKSNTGVSWVKRHKIVEILGH